MCLAVPAKIISVEDQFATVEIEGVRRQCNVAFIEDPQVGDYLLMHAGFAIRKWTEDEVREFYEIIETAEEPVRFVVEEDGGP